MIFNNINADAIGNIVLGGTQVVESIDIAITSMAKGDSTKELGEAIQRLTNAVLTDNSISQESRDELLDKINFLTENVGAKTPAKKSIIKPVVDSISGVLSGAGGAVIVWQQCEPAIRSWFGI